MRGSVTFLRFYPQLCYSGGEQGPGERDERCDVEQDPVETVAPTIAAGMAGPVNDQGYHEEGDQSEKQGGYLAAGASGCGEQREDGGDA